jgi:signal peptide peptidase SppA
MKSILATQELLLIEPRRWFAKLEEFETHQAGLVEMLFGEEPTAAQSPEVDGDGMATVEIAGPIVAGLPWFAEQFGYARPELIREQLEYAATNPAVKAIVLDIDSPGGTVTGTPELASFVQEVGATKPIYAFTSGLCCSAAYWIAAPSRAILATPSSEVGSIGVYVAHQDMSALARAMGIVVNVFRSGKYKGAGVPGTSLSEAQSAEIQAKVDSLAALFKSFVTEHRPGMNEETMQGQTFMGYKSAGVRLIDGLVGDIKEAKKVFAQLDK